MLYIVLLSLAFIIIVVLSVIAYRLRSQLKSQRQQQKEQRDSQLAAERDLRQRTNKSIQILAQGVLEEQLTLTEASIRISGLLESLGDDDSIRQEYVAFFQLAEATAHIPILGEWKKLSLKKRLAFDDERTRLEIDYREFIMDAAQRIQGKEF